MTRSRSSAPVPPRGPTPDLLPIQETLLEELRRPIRIRTEGVEQEITFGQAAVKKLIQAALAGSPHALGQVMWQSERAQALEAKQIAERVKTGRAFLESSKTLLKKWTEVGKDPKLYVPHPDDIIVTDGFGWEVKGPLDEDELAQVLKRRDERDALVVQATLEERLASKQEWLEAGENTQKKPGAMAWFMVHMIDSTLPARFRLTALDLIRFDRIYNRMTKRELLKHTVAVWRKLGKSMPRGQRLPALHDMLPMIHAVYGTAGAMLKREKAGRPMELSEISRELETRRRCFV